jgi:hypothetical protein
MEILVLACLLAGFLYMHHNSTPNTNPRNTIFMGYGEINKPKFPSRVEMLEARRRRVYRIYLAMLTENNQLKANQAMLIIKRIDHQLSFYYYPKNFRFN